MSRRRGCGVRHFGGGTTPGSSRNSPSPAVRPTNIFGLKIAAAGSACGRGAVCSFVLAGGVL